METVTREMIEWLREKASVSIVGRGGPEVVVEKAMLERVADMLEHYSYMNELAENRKYRKRYVEWWRKKNGESDLTYPDFDNVYKDFWELMDSQDKWASVDERLPEESGDYLVIANSGSIFRYYYSHEELEFGEYVEIELDFVEKPDTVWISLDTITHWMPIPALPKEVQK